MTESINIFMFVNRTRLTLTQRDAQSCTTRMSCEHLTLREDVEMDDSDRYGTKGQRQNQPTSGASRENAADDK